MYNSPFEGDSHVVIFVTVLLHISPIKSDINFKVKAVKIMSLDVFDLFGYQQMIKQIENVKTRNFNSFLP